MSLYCVNTSLCLHHVANLYLHTPVTHKQTVTIFFFLTNFLYKPDSNSLFIYGSHKLLLCMHPKPAPSVTLQPVKVTHAVTT